MPARSLFVINSRIAKLGDILAYHRTQQLPFIGSTLKFIAYQLHLSYSQTGIAKSCQTFKIESKKLRFNFKQLYKQFEEVTMSKMLSDLIFRSRFSFLFYFQRHQKVQITSIFASEKIKENQNKKIIYQNYFEYEN